MGMNGNKRYRGLVSQVDDGEQRALHKTALVEWQELAERLTRENNALFNKVGELQGRVAGQKIEMERLRAELVRMDAELNVANEKLESFHAAGVVIHGGCVLVPRPSVKRELEAVPTIEPACWFEDRSNMPDLLSMPRAVKREYIEEVAGNRRFTPVKSAESYNRFVADVRYPHGETSGSKLEGARDDWKPELTEVGFQDQYGDDDGI